MRRKGPIIFAWIMFIISEVFAGLSFHFMGDIDKKWKDHARNSVIFMVILVAHSMVLFRILPCIRTRVLKYIHFLVHTVCLVGAILAWKSIKDKDHDYSSLHKILSLITMIVYVIQWFLAVFVFLYLYSNQARRKTFAGFHNFIGICILQFSIATSITMLQEINFDSANEVASGKAIICLVVYGMLINIIVLNPYVEWRLIGPI